METEKKLKIEIFVLPVHEDFGHPLQGLDFLYGLQLVLSVEAAGFFHSSIMCHIRATAMPNFSVLPLFLSLRKHNFTGKKAQKIDHLK